MSQGWEKYRNKIVGLGENSFKKSYYPELQKKIEELENSKLNFETIFDSTKDAIIIHDKDGNILNLNKEAQILYNIKDDEKQKYTIFDISSAKNDVSNLNNIWAEVFKNGAITIEWIAAQIDTGIEFPVQVSINITKWNNKDVMVAVIRDFTERKKYEEELIIAREKAEENNRLKTAFLQNMSHEIRTPMNAIVGFSQFLQEANLSKDEIEEYTSIIINSSNQLLTIVTDILTISSLETKNEKVANNEFNLNKMMDELLLIFRKQADIKEISLFSKKQLEDKDAIILSDQVKLKQILVNLLTNSMKFTSTGFIEFGYVVQNKNLKFWVEDTGVGIKEEDKEKIFERFFQSKDSKNQNFGGTGLGLAISKGFVELMNGKIWLESQYDKGSIFNFIIPFNPANDVLINKIQNLSKENSTTILVAEDEEVNFYFLEIILKKLNYKLLHSKDGEETIELCKANNEIDLVLMDIKMPKMDGYSAAKIIKGFRPNLPIIAQSAYINEFTVDTYNEEAFDDYISKPIKKNILIQKLVKFIA